MLPMCWERPDETIGAAESTRPGGPLMRSRILVPALALAALVPAGTAAAMPIREPIIRSHPAPPPAAPAPAPQDSGGVLGYVLVGLGGLAVGAAGTVSVRRVRH